MACVYEANWSFLEATRWKLTMVQVHKCTVPSLSPNCILAYHVYSLSVCFIQSGGVIITHDSQHPMVPKMQTCLNFAWIHHLGGGGISFSISSLKSLSMTPGNIQEQIKQINITITVTMANDTVVLVEVSFATYSP